MPNLKIWHAASLPLLAELRPPDDLLEHKADIPIKWREHMQRLPGQQSYCKAIGLACGAAGAKSREAWNAFGALGQAVYDEITTSFATTECATLSDDERAGVRRFVRLLLTPDGIALLQDVASELGGSNTSTKDCWAWCAATEPAQAIAMRFPPKPDAFAAVPGTFMASAKVKITRASGASNAF